MGCLSVLFMTYKISVDSRNVVLLEDDDPLDFLDSADQTFEERLESAKQRIGDVANAVLATSRSLFLPDSKSGESKSPEENRSPEIQKQQLEAMAKVSLIILQLHVRGTSCCHQLQDCWSCLLVKDAFPPAEVG